MCETGLTTLTSFAKRLVVFQALLKMLSLAFLMGSEQCLMAASISFSTALSAPLPDIFLRVSLLLAHTFSCSWKQSDTPSTVEWTSDDCCNASRYFSALPSF